MMTVELKEFLHSKSMLTPGIAGGLTMFLTNGVCAQFDIPPNWTGLAFSALFGILIMAQATEPWLMRTVLYVLNTAVIFAMAAGAANTTAAVAHKSEQSRPNLAQSELSSTATGPVLILNPSPTSEGETGSKHRAPEVVPPIFEGTKQKVASSVSGEFGINHRAAINSLAEPASKAVFFRSWF